MSQENIAETDRKMTSMFERYLTVRPELKAGH